MTTTPRDYIQTFAHKIDNVPVDSIFYILPEESISKIMKNAFYFI